METRAPGTYGVSETVLAGWQLDSANCSDGSPVTAIDLQAGENVTCTFTNSLLAVHMVSVPLFSRGGLVIHLLAILIIAGVFQKHSGLNTRQRL